MTKTPRQRLESLLKIHGGHCFIVEACEDFWELEAAAEDMHREGLATVTEGTGNVPGIDVKRKGYRITKAKPGEQEPQAH